MAQSDVLHDTVFPTATDKDLCMQVRIIREKYGRLYPEVSYYAMNVPITDPHEGDVPDVPPPEYETEVDDLWGEPVPTGQKQGLEWENPHTSAILDATEGNKRVDKGKMRVHLNHEPSQKALSRYAIDEERVIIATFFRPLLEDAAIVVRHGDQFFWNDHVYEVLKWSRKGYWKNTSVWMYVEAACKYARYGS
jgi:hypothetical protein